MLDALTAAIGAAFLLALLGGVHCAGMCGGFVSALQLNRAPRLSRTALVFGYHAGRLTAYSLAGLLAGSIGGAMYATEVLPVQVLLLCIGSTMLLAIGAALLGKRRLLARLEPLGLLLWRALSPLVRRVYPPRSRLQAYATGLLWGWIPCGMVYAALPLALTAGSPLAGAAIMVGFGIGTLPAMLLLDVAFMRFARKVHAGPGAHAGGGVSRWIKMAAGAMILAFGISGFAHAARISGVHNAAIAAVASICHR